MDKITHKMRCEQWSKIVNDCLASGMKKTEWCRQNGISDKAFFYWQRILRQEAYIEAPAKVKSLPDIAETKVSRVDETAFVELKQPIHSETVNSVFEPDVIIRAGNLTIEISNHASETLLGRIPKAAKESARETIAHQALVSLLKSCVFETERIERIGLLSYT
jgi:putative transposase